MGVCGEKVMLSWSSGKDCAWALHILRRQGVNVVGLLSTFNEAFGRMAMHSTRREIAEAQAEAAGLPLWAVMLPWPCSNEAYEERIGEAMRRVKEAGVTAMAFGDLFLEDIRKYREEKMAGTGIRPIFPLWGTRKDTPGLAREMLAAGLKAFVSSVDPKQIDRSFVGRAYDAGFVGALPPAADPCGENGEFHTICWDGPMFMRPVALRAGEVVERDGFWYADFELEGGEGRPPTA
ncbi:MAG TPA: ATP-binding protein [Candidatus Brocadiia bacterium]|nr:ATP-binding protein [Candidatus Brocadiia bacterium]